MMQRRGFIGGFAALFAVVAVQAPVLSLARDLGAALELEIVREQVVDDPNSFGFAVQWLVRCGDRYAVAWCVVSDWNSLQLRELARNDLREQVVLHFKQRDKGLA